MHFSPDPSGASPSEALVRFVAVDKQDSVCPCFSFKVFFFNIFICRPYLHWKILPHHVH